jgi:hypothetical protein
MHTHVWLHPGLLYGVTAVVRNDVSGGWNEDLKWTEQMNEGWDAAKAKAVVDELIATFGPQK